MAAFWQHFYHLVWTTKDRQPWITAEIETHLFAYLGHKAKELEMTVYAMNGTEDHVHIVAAIPPKHSISHVVKVLKGSSSHFVNSELNPSSKFSWRAGYGSFTLGHSHLERAKAYVLNQKQHHAEKTTNAWLERVKDDEEKTSLSSSVREAQAPYNLGPLPF